MLPPCRILVSDSPGERRAAVLDGAERVVAVFHARTGDAEVGSLHLGRVTGRLPDGRAAFVDIGGDGPPGFLNATDVRGGLPAEGAAVIVQVTAEARREKGPRLTAKLSFTDSVLAYTPHRPGVSVSSKLPADLRDILRIALSALLDPGEGAVVRTGATGPELPASLDAHRAAWKAAQAAAETGRPPLRLSPPADGLADALALCPDPEEIVFDHAPALTAARRAHAALAGRMRAEGRDLFAQEGVDEAIEQALQPVVPLPCGGRLVIEPTAALVAVDVDAGPAAPAVANTEAMAELVRQLDLRGLAGMIVCDVVPDQADRSRRGLLEDLRLRLAGTAVPTHIAGVSRLGLVELRRDRGRAPLAERLGDGSGRLSDASLALAALRRAVWQAAAEPGGGPLVLTLAPAVAEAARPFLAEAEARLHRPVVLDPRPDCPRKRVEIASSHRS
ncbi:ribonuclease E/G [Caenispirillum bisanense]|uniref:Ribonuclease E/ribonuclease G n=1 Tax=Caenispirillum bisanense TaxID=414052 RepID=A0A286H1R7_9PROT|nr:ribonuclease E/G [Caenispirillum bisanense]SOE01406.1 ribonuclease E/ribonuclease G [Caenispirillum bisanense]